MEALGRKRVAAPGVANDHYASNPVAFNAVALMQHRIQAMGAAAPRAGGGGGGGSGGRTKPAAAAAAAAPRRANHRARSSEAVERPWQQRRRPQAVAASAADTGTAAADGDDSDSDSDGDGDSRPARAPQLSLAQRLGLVEMPDMPLTSDEWEAAAAASKQRDYAAEPCAICCAPFRDEKQVILSCSHVFHRYCLKSWEAFSKSQRGAKTCPCCRREAYQKRTFTSEGGEIYRTKCAVLIQAHVRGLVARRAVERLWMQTNPGKRRAYCERRLASLTDRLTTNLAGHDGDVDDFLASIDTSLAASRAVFAAADVDWAYTERLARGMAGADHVCPICIASTCEHVHGDCTRDLTLLPCSHVFHGQCLAAFEKFAAGDEAQSRLCPSCREPYASRRDFAWAGDAAGCGSVDRPVGFSSADEKLKPPAHPEQVLQSNPVESEPVRAGAGAGAAQARAQKQQPTRRRRRGGPPRSDTVAGGARPRSIPNEVAGAGRSRSRSSSRSVLHGRRRGERRKGGAAPDVERALFRMTM
jgi:hypothetical protein